MFEKWFLLRVCLLLMMYPIEGAHYKGGTITWRPINPFSTGNSIEILVTEKHSWTLSRYLCNLTTINSMGLYRDWGGSPPSITCRSSLAACNSSRFGTIAPFLWCTDFSNTVEISTGMVSVRLNISGSTNIDIGFVSAAWAYVITQPNGSPASSYSLLSHIDLTATYPINSSPVTGSLPIIRVIENQTAIIQIPAADWDVNQMILCRWASNTSVYGDECGDICMNLPNATLSPTDCTITWYAVRRPLDIVNGTNTSTYVAAIMVEDFLLSNNTTRLSSVPLQMLIYVYQPTNVACQFPPQIIGVRPSRACIGVPINVPLTEQIVAEVYCSGDSIVEYVTTAPMYMRKTTIIPVAGTSNLFSISLTWTAVLDQYGPQVFCASPIDQNQLTGSQYCITFLVGVVAPNLIMNTGSPGRLNFFGSSYQNTTIYSNHSLFSIQANALVGRPYRNGTFIQIYVSNNNTLVWQVDCGYSSLVSYSNYTISFQVINPSWIPGASYYVLFSSGAASGNLYCGAESAPITDPTFWVSTIANDTMATISTTTTNTLTSLMANINFTSLSNSTLVSSTNSMNNSSMMMTTTNNTQNNLGETSSDNIKWLLIGIGVGVGTMIPLCFLSLFCVHRQMNKRNKINNVKPFTSPPLKQNHIRPNVKGKKAIRR